MAMSGMYGLGGAGTNGSHVTPASVERYRRQPSAEEPTEANMVAGAAGSMATEAMVGDGGSPVPIEFQVLPTRVKRGRG